VLKIGFRSLIVATLLLLGGLLSIACEEGATARVGSTEARQQTGKDLEALRVEVQNEISTSRKEQALRRCRTAADRLRRADDPDLARLTDLCQSIEATDPNTPAAWDDIRSRLDDLIKRFQG
jgi:hypothetical protein